MTNFEASRLIRMTHMYFSSKLIDQFGVPTMPDLTLEHEDAIIRAYHHAVEREREYEHLLNKEKMNG